MDNSESLPVVLQREIEGKGMLSPVRVAAETIENIGLDLLVRSFSRIISHLSTVVDNAKAASPSLQIDQIQINLEIRSDLGFALVGSASAGAKTAIQVVLREKVSDDPLRATGQGAGAGPA